MQQKQTWISWKSMWKVDFCGVVLATQKNNILEFNQYMKLDKILYMIHFDIESLIEKIDNINNDLEKSSTTQKKNKKK